VSEVFNLTFVELYLAQLKMEAIMPAIQTIVLNDGLATPVAHSFAPQSIVGTVVRYEDRVTDVKLGYPTLEISKPIPPKGSTVQRVIFTLKVPTLSSLQTLERKMYEHQFKGEFFLPLAGTLLQRKDLLAFTRGLLAEALVTAMIEEEESVY
jgi:hypothetical protein